MSQMSVGRLTAVLAVFLVLGSAMALFIWHTLSDFLAGKPVEGGDFLLALAMTGVFAGLAWLMAHFLLKAFPPE
jgi:hypothetical protein